MVEIPDVATNLRLLEEGIWISKNTSQDLSYPKDGNRTCFQIEERSFWFKHRNNCLLEVLKRFPPPGRLYDIGGGNGYVSLAFEHGGFEAIVVEPGIEGARNAKSRGLTPVICSSLEEAGFRESMLPAVGIFDVLEHIEDDSGFLRTIKSFLVSRGRLYLTVPAYKILWSAEDDFAGHYRRYTLKELSHKLAAVGFEIEYATYFFSLLIVPIFLFRTIPSKMGLKQTRTAKQRQDEHNPKPGILGSLLNWHLGKELSQLKSHQIGWGASCLVVARAQ